MEYIREQMFTIHTIFWKEINLLKINLDKFMEDSERCQQVFREFNSTERVTNIFGLVVFDRYMTQMGTALNMARKYNIHLEINSLEKTVINASSNGCIDDTDFTQTRLLKDFIEWSKICLENDMGFNGENNGCAGRIKMTERMCKMVKVNALGCGNGRAKSLEFKKNDNRIKWLTDRTNPISIKIDDLLDVLLPKKCLDEFKSGFEFEASVVYVRDYKKLEFFICLNDDSKTLHELSCNINFRAISSDFLSTDDVFCVLENRDNTKQDRLWRAVMVPEEHNSQKLLYLLDFGEIIPLTDLCEFYEAPLRYRQIAPLAIKCVLEGVEDHLLKCITKDQDKCMRALQKHEFGKANFRITYQKNEVLHVVMQDNYNQTNPFYNSKAGKDPNYSTNFAGLELHSSIIYQSPREEEPLSSIPQEARNKIQVVVTHVVSPISFYGIVQNDYCDKCKTFSWHDNQISALQKGIPQPQVNDIVLSQYIKDGYWYRAKVINIDSENNLYKVFYVDFGNIEVVPLSGLAKCAKEQLNDPLRAVLFYLADLSIVSDNQNDHSLVKSAIENMVVMLLDQMLNIEIVERRNDGLVVRLMDSQFAGVPKILLDMGVVKEM